MQASGLRDGLETSTGCLQAALIVGNQRRLILRHYLLVDRIITFVCRTVAHFANRGRYVVDKAFGLVRSWTSAIYDRLEPSLQVAELLTCGIIVALPKLIKQSLQLRKAGLLALVDLRAQSPCIAAVLLDETGFQTCRAKIPTLQILTSSTRVAAGNPRPDVPEQLFRVWFPRAFQRNQVL